MRVSSAPSETFGRYRLLELIGQGGMAEVYKAKSFGVEGFEKILVIKRIVPELAKHDQFVKMFVQEAKLAVRLSHANIVQVFDLGRIDRGDGAPPSYFIAMEHVPGVDLATVLEHSKRAQRAGGSPFPIGAALYIVAEVAKALDHAHRRTDEQGKPLGIVHRDISPHNVLLSWDGDVKVTDFGIAKAADTIEKSDDLAAARATGKISFMSPEQSRSEATDARSDLFSLGIVMYQMLAGENPFVAPTISETVRRIGASEYPPLGLARSDVPDALVRLVDKLLAAQAADRIGSAADLFEELLAYAYTAGERFAAGDLAQLLSPLREAESDTDISGTDVLDEPSVAVDKTPVEIPQVVSEQPPAPLSEPGGGDRREVTALVVPFSASSKDGGSEELSTRIREVLERHGAWLEELSETQVVAIFGMGDTDGRDADAAVRAGLSIVRERRLGEVQSAGIHSGPISVDDGGIPLRDERMAALVASAQTLARLTEGQVVLSPVTARLVRRSFVTESLPPTARLVADGLVVRGALTHETARGRFVGRRAELKKLGTLLATATRGEPQLVVLQGETGIGKTRFLLEATRRLERGRFNLAFYSCSCPLNGASESWSGMRAMLHVLCGTQQDDDTPRILEVRPRLRALGLRDEQADSVLSLLGAPVGLKVGELRSSLRASFERMVASLCKDKLHCFAFDDAQALDAETLDAMLRILHQHERLRAVFVLSQRGDANVGAPHTPGFRTLQSKKKLHLIELGELSERDVASLLELQLGARAIPEELLAYVRSCAGGHPLFIEELVRELCDSGTVQVMSGTITLRAPAQQSAPRTLRTLIGDRVSRLQQRERRVLQGIAILGEPTITTVLAPTLDQPLPNIDRYLSNLEQKGLIARTGPTQVRFASPLYREIVLSAMAPATLQELQLAAASFYLRSGAPAGGEVTERIATHLVGAGERDRAVDYFWRAADERLAVGQIDAALRAMLRGMELADLPNRTVAQICEWLHKLARTVSQTRQAPGLKEMLLPATREIRDRGDDGQRVMAYVEGARALGAVNLFDDAYEALEKVDPETLRDRELEIARYSAECELAARQGNFARAAKACEKLDELGPIDDVRALVAMCLARGAAGDTKRALELLDRFEKLSDPSDIVQSVTLVKHRTLVHFNARDFAAAARDASTVAKLAIAAGLRFEAAIALHNLGDAADRVGDHPRAYAAFVESLELTRQLEQDRLSNLNQLHLCLLDGLRNPEAAEEKLKALIRYADARGYLWDVLEGRFLLARLWTAHGNHERARRLLEEIIRTSNEQGHGLIGVDAAELLEKLALS
jgi:serine/threonine protein kinase/tetratricopeptide (TPR) repeat protein